MKLALQNPYVKTGLMASAFMFSTSFLEAAELAVPGDHPTIQAAITAATAGDIIVLSAGTYTEGTISVNKAVTIQGPKAGTHGADPGRAHNAADEAIIRNSQLNITANATVDGVVLFWENVALSNGAVFFNGSTTGATVKNSLFYRTNTSGGGFHMAITNSFATTGFLIQDNFFTGNSTGYTTTSGVRSWRAGIWINGNGSTSGTITGNNFRYCNTAINADANSGSALGAIAINNNTFREAGTQIAFGGAVTGQYTMTGNDFPLTGTSVLFNNSNVATAFRVDATTSTFGGVAAGALTDAQKFALELRVDHRGKGSKNGVIDYLPNQQVVRGTTIANGIEAAAPGDTVLVYNTTFTESLNVTKPLTILGARHGVSAIGRTPNTSESRITGGFHVTAPGVVIDGFRITGGHNVQPNGVYVAAAGVEIRNNILTGINSDYAIELQAGPFNGLQVAGNSITGNLHGIYLNPGSGHSITNNQISGNGVGIGSDGQSDLTVSGNVFSNNTLEGIGSSNVGSNVEVSQNNFTGNGTAVAHYGGSPITATHNYWGGTGTPLGSGPFAPNNTTQGSVNFSPWYADAARTILVLPENVVIDDEQSHPDLFIAPGMKVTVTDTGSLGAGKLTLSEGAELIVEGGDLTIGEDSTISGSFTIFNSFGSWNINGNTTFNIGTSLALITDIHVAAGSTLSVNGGGRLILDGSVIDSQTPGSPYYINVANDGLLTIARSVVSDARIDIDTSAFSAPDYRRSLIYDSSFTGSDIEASADSAVFHNLFDAATAAAANTDGTTAFADVNGWGNVTDEADLKNRFFLEFDTATNPAVNTLDADGNLFVRPGDPVVLSLEVGALDGHAINAAEALLGYNSDLLTYGGVTPEPGPLGWHAIAAEDSASGSLGLIDRALGLNLVDPGDDGIEGPATLAKVNFTAANPGLTLGFFRVQTNDEFGGPDTLSPDVLTKDTRLTKSEAGWPSYLAAFTENSGELVIDDELPVIDTDTVTAVQDQDSPEVDVLDHVNGARVFRAGEPVVLTFEASDLGLAGLDADDVDNDLTVTVTNGPTTLTYTAAAVEDAGIVTYTVTLAVPDTATIGTYTITASVLDRSGNSSGDTSLGEFVIGNEVLVSVELESGAPGFTGTRDVTFAATGGGLATWTKAVDFTNGVGTAHLDNVPDGTTGISAKTAWHLRSKVEVTLGDTVLPVDITGGNKLPGGDLNGDNIVNTLDYSILRYHWFTDHDIADIDGDEAVIAGDYNILQANFYTIGDPQ